MTKSQEFQKYLSHTFVLVLSGALELWRKPKPAKGSCTAAAADDNDKEDDFDGDDNDHNNNNNNNNNKYQVRHFRFLSNYYK